MSVSNPECHPESRDLLVTMCNVKEKRGNSRSFDCAPTRPAKEAGLKDWAGAALRGCD